MAEMYDGDWRLMDYDPLTGVTKWFLPLDDERFIVRTETPVDQLLEENAEAYNESEGKRWGSGKIVASIPLNIFWKELQPAMQQRDSKYVHKWLNDSDHRKFRTFKGTI